MPPPGRSPKARTIPTSRGLPQLREAVAAHYNRHYGQELDASQICIQAAPQTAVGAEILALSPRDEV